MEEAIKDIKRVSEEFCEGNAPTWRDAVEHCEHHPETYTKRFDCKWNDLIEEAELDINTPGVKEGNHNYSKKELISEIERLSEEYHDGNTPTCTTLEKHGEYSQGAYRSHFGTWTEALDKAGYEKNIKSFSTDNPKKEMIREIKRVSIEELDGKRPGWEDVVRHAQCPIAFQEHFDSWNNAVEAAGFERYEIDDVGKDHWLWKGGYVGHYGSSWSQRRKEVRERDGKICRVCNTPQSKTMGSLEVHHITPCRYWVVENEHKKMNHPRNLISLCISCHRELDGMFKGRSHEKFEELAREYMILGWLGESIFEY